MTSGRGDVLQKLRNPVAWIRNSISKWGLEWFADRYYGTYAGIVIDNKDPENRGRIRAIIPTLGMKSEEHVGKNYWALPCMTGLGTDPYTKHMTGQFHPPDIGNNVWITFQNGDSAFPIYMGGFVTVDNASDTFSSEDVYKKGIRTKTGHYIKMNDDPDDLSLVIGRGDGEGTETPMFLSFSKEGHTTITNILGSTLYMNGEKPETSLMTANENGEVTALLMLGDDKITLATKSGGSIGINGKDTTITGDNVIADCTKDFIANSGGVKLGKGASEPAVRGLKFMQWSLIHQHTITTPVPGSPTGPGPTPPPMLYNELSEKVFIS